MIPGSGGCDECYSFFVGKRPSDGARIFRASSAEGRRHLLARAFQEPGFVEGSSYGEPLRDRRDCRRDLASAFKRWATDVRRPHGRGRRASEYFLHGGWLAFSRGQTSVRSREWRLPGKPQAIETKLLALNSAAETSVTAIVASMREVFTIRRELCGPRLCRAAGRLVATRRALRQLILRDSRSARSIRRSGNPRP
jgi:hypothetical protein